MLRIRLLLLLLSVAFALLVVLLRPLPSRADNGGETPPPPPDPTPAEANPIVPPLPVVPAPKAVRRPAAAHHAVRSLFGRRVIDYAKHFLGVPYVYGGSSPRSGFDCSGFVRFVYAHFGVSLAHSSFAQFRRGVRVGRWGLKPGDLVFFDGLGHVGIYVGGGRFIHAPHTGTRVEISPLRGWYSSRFDGGRRLHVS